MTIADTSRSIQCMVLLFMPEGFTLKAPLLLLREGKDFGNILFSTNGTLGSISRIEFRETIPSRDYRKIFGVRVDMVGAGKNLNFDSQVPQGASVDHRTSYKTKL
ncbi:hypothetical protein AYI69_g11141 [Smittium culicis]|uniref:Uncharacterized protein n=1 Tax=Smittium culicis TaxID=133412 RepID=A0A1R1X0T3_9FUNG|nr:hypothetical protein AYI69_g11141 [Smittium culicis]